MKTRKKLAHTLVSALTLLLVSHKDLQSMESATSGIESMLDALGATYQRSTLGDGLDGKQAIPLIGLNPFKEPNRNHYEAREEKPQYLIMHGTAANVGSTMDIFTKDIDNGRVSAHFVITEPEKENGITGGEIVQIPPRTEGYTTWHAGVSKWGDISGLNKYSIGIEHVGKGFEEDLTYLDWYEGRIKQWFPFDGMQIRASGTLCSKLVQEFSIPPTHVLGHADIVYYRKSNTPQEPHLGKHDPGPRFPWETLYCTYSVGAWLEHNERNEKEVGVRYAPKEPLCPDNNGDFFLQYLKNYGWDVPEGVYTPEDARTKALLMAFRNHYVGIRKNNPLTKEDMLVAWGLHAKYKDFLF